MTLRLGDGSLVVTDTQSYSDEPSTAYSQGRQRDARGRNKCGNNKKRQQDFVDSCYYLSIWMCSVILGFTIPHSYLNK